MNIKTALNHYRFDVSKPDQAEAYAKLLTETLQKIGFPVWMMQFEGYYTHDKTKQEFMQKVRDSVGAIELETEYLFDNQWNSTCLRLFNWAECKYPNKDIREGYYLTQTDDMREVLRSTVKCGYCGNQEPAAKGYVFCEKCLDSEYLKRDDLRLLRMVPICRTNEKRRELTDAERDHLIPLYVKAQKEGSTERGKARIAKARKDAANDRKKTIAEAEEKYSASMWILDNVPGLHANWLYYTHTNRHCFGWREALDVSVASQLLDVISEFPFLYTIKCADGRVLEN